MKASALILLLSLCILPVLAIPLQKENNPKRIAEAIKNNNIAFLENYITAENINDCYTLSNSAYNMLAMSIKSNAKESFDFIVQRADLESICAGKTALMYAVKYGQIDMVKKLVDSGANLKRDNNGKTVIDYARKYKQDKILSYLQSLDKEFETKFP